MKRHDTVPNLRDAFAPIPEPCKQALMNVARSVQEEYPMKRKPLRVALIAALILAATIAVAYASQQLGWVDFFQGYQGVGIPKAGVELLTATKPQAYQVGPLTFTFNQMLADGRIALCAAEIRATDHSEALYAPETDIFDPVDAGSGDNVLTRYRLAPRTGWFEAAKQLSLPLYAVRATAEVDEPYSAGVAMSDALWGDDGSITFFSMPFTTPETTKDALPVTLNMRVWQYDPATGEVIAEWESSEPAVVPVSAMIEERTYLPQGEAALHGLALTSVRAERYVTGVYLLTTFTAPEGMDEDEAVRAAYHVAFRDAQGVDFPSGISLSGDANTDAFPTVVLQSMITAEELPESMLLTDDTNTVEVR